MLGGSVCRECRTGNAAPGSLAGVAASTFVEPKVRCFEKKISMGICALAAMKCCDEGPPPHKVRSGEAPLTAALPAFNSKGLSVAANGTQ